MEQEAKNQAKARKRDSKKCNDVQDKSIETIKVNEAPQKKKKRGRPSKLSQLVETEGQNITDETNWEEKSNNGSEEEFYKEVYNDAMEICEL